jgi:hypothetical protein
MQAGMLMLKGDLMRTRRALKSLRVVDSTKFWRPLTSAA